MATLRVPVEHLAPGRLVLDDEAASYVARVHRCAVGERLALFDPARALVGEATVASSRPKVVLEVTSVGPAPRPRRAVTLVQGHAKADKVDAVLRDATELGVTRVVVTATERAVVRVSPDKVAERLARLGRVAVQAARQCGRADVPTLELASSLREALAALGDQGEGALRVALEPTAERTLGALYRDARADAELTLVVGPEGGLTEGELALAASAGFERARFGAWIMRTETVCAAALGAWLARDEA
jgi:16S rRNA (uracil1498-N3)-methyltransferase